MRGSTHQVSRPARRRHSSCSTPDPGPAHFPMLARAPWPPAPSPSPCQSARPARGPGPFLQTSPARGLAPDRAPRPDRALGVPSPCLGPSCGSGAFLAPGSRPQGLALCCWGPSSAPETVARAPGATHPSSLEAGGQWAEPWSPGPPHWSGRLMTSRSSWRLGNPPFPWRRSGGLGT